MTLHPQTDILWSESTILNMVGFHTIPANEINNAALR